MDGDLQGMDYRGWGLSSFRKTVCKFVGQTIKVFACDVVFRGKLACCEDSFAVLATTTHPKIHLIYLPFRQICAVSKD